MTSLSARRARILRVRELEHIIAKARASAADDALDNLNRISERINVLRLSLHPKGGNSGQQMRAMGEMQQRLARAQDDLAQPIRNACDESEHLSALSRAAYLREEGATKLHDKAVRDEVAASALRADANRPPRMRKAGVR